ncbi:MAG: 30S ribosomal protein S18 [Janthinobacterium lividum]
MSESENSNSSSEQSSRPNQVRRPFFHRQKTCPFNKPGSPKIDYKDVRLLSRSISEQGRITPRRISAVSAKPQRALALAIKRARFLALLPYVAR